MGRKEVKQANQQWRDYNPSMTKRLMLVGLVATVILTGLGGRLFYLQVYKHDLYSTEVNKQRNITIPLTSGRGMILDRNLIPLTDREEETVAMVFPQLFMVDEENTAFLAEITGLSPVYLKALLTTGGYPVELAIENELDWQDQRLVNTRGLFVVSRRNRYGAEHVLSHTIGYMSGADRRGITGIEKAMESYLSGQESHSVIAILDGRKRLIPGEGYTLNNTSEKEQHVQLTVDYHVQKIAEGVLDQKNYTGAVVISRIESGEILALASRPNFNPNQINEHINSQGDELYHRGIQMTFPPGSIFKIIVAAAALEQGVTSLGEDFFCSGSETVGNVEIKCSSYEQGGNGDLTFEEAFAQSCNSTFIQIGQRLGAKSIIEMAEKFGLGQKVDILLDEEEAGYLPEGDQLLGPAIGNVSIGQGEIEVTPLQVNQMTQMIANSGVKKPLYLIDQVLDGNNNVIHEINQQEEEAPFLSEKTIAQLQYLMEKTMVEGTGKGVGEILAQATAGKTGTAQSSFMGESVAHAWFTGYYPTDAPEFAITIFVQDGQSGSGAAVPAFKKILEEMQALGY